MIILLLLRKLPLYLDCAAWTHKYSLLNKKTIVPLFLTILLSYPKGNSNSLLSLYKLTQLIFLIDDLFDDDLTNIDKLILEMSGDYPIDETDKVKMEFIKCFSDIKNTVFFNIKDKEMQQNWLANVNEMIVVMGLEKNHTSYDSIEEYITVSKKSVGLYMYNWTLAMEMDIDITKNEKELEKIIEHAAKFIRFSNDIRSYKRELSEGKTNSLSILMAHGSSEINAKKSIHILANTEYINLYSTEVNDDRIKIFKGNLLRYIDFIDILYGSDDFRDSKSRKFIKLLFTPLSKFGDSRPLISLNYV